jgi:hypothetical protein
MSTPSQPSEAPDLAAVERDLRGWSWATGGWAAFHALGGLFVVASGGLSGVPSGALRLVILVLVGAWATTAIASWAILSGQGRHDRGCCVDSGGHHDAGIGSRIRQSRSQR